MISPLTIMRPLPVRPLATTADDMDLTTTSDAPLRADDRWAPDTRCTHGARLPRVPQPVVPDPTLIGSAYASWR